MTGIAETNTPDVFAIIAGNWSMKTFTGTKGSFAVWSVDLRSDPPNVAIIRTIPESTGLNGLAVIKNSANIILMADSSLGAVWAMNPKTGKAKVTIQHPDLEPGGPFPLGINGINTRGRDLHFVNSGKGIYGSMPLRSDGSSTGKVKHISTLEPSLRYDDFAFDRAGNALVATHPNHVYKVSLDGQQSLHSNSSVFAEPTSSIFGRGSKKEEATLYLSTGGRKGEGGQVVALENYQTSMESEVEEVTYERWTFVQQVLGRRGVRRVV